MMDSPALHRRSRRPREVAECLGVFDSHSFEQEEYIVNTNQPPRTTRSNSSDHTRLNRREVLEIAGLAGAASIAYPLAASASEGGVSAHRALQNPEQDARRGGVLVAAWEEDAATLDPVKTYGGHETRIVYQFAETLWGLSRDNVDPEGLIATDWMSSDDGLIWTVDIRPDMTFHDGTAVDAEAVQWNFDRWLNPENPFYDPPYGLLSYYLGGIEGVNVVDPLQLQISLGAPDSTFAARIMASYAAVISPTAVQEMGNEAFGQLPVGSGPFKVESWDKGVRIVLERNDDYWGDPAHLDQVIIQPIAESAARLTALQQGEVDFIVAMAPEFIPVVESDSSLQVLQSLGSHIWWISLNMHDEHMQDVRVRQALNYAIDKETIVETILYGAATVTPGAMISHSWGNNPDVEPYPYDPERAIALLAEAGYPDGLTTRFWVPDSGSGMVAPQEIGQVVQAYLADVGVTAEIVTQEWTSYVADWGYEGLDAGDFGMGEMSWNFSAADPAEWLNPNLMTNAIAPEAFNGGYYSNEQVDDLLSRALASMDLDERTALYQEAQAVIREDCPWIFMFSANNVAAASAAVKGLVLNPSPSVVSLSDAYFEE